ncbi:xanthine dehydrogenase family protein subunit M [Thermoplasmatales archaeon AK]|nr:xanthine dehydrogenase family protein subunit M [Thermoplasmatales archaeon AK]
MYPKSFQYSAPSTLQEALQILKENPEARPVAGGQSIMPMLKLRILDPGFLIDLMHLKELKNITEGHENELHIGAMVTHNRIINEGLIREYVPMLALTAEHIGDVQIRNRGTIGGSICEADPSADYLPTLLVLDAKVALQSLDGERIVPVSEFITGPFSTDIQEGEILREVIVQKNRMSFSVEKYARRRADFAVASAAVICDVDSSGRIRQIKVAVGAQSNGPMRLDRLEKALTGKNRDSVDINEIVESVRGDLDPLSDLHGSSEYRRDVTVNMLKRIITNLVYRGGEQ